MVHGLGEHLHEQLGLGWEVAVDGAGGHLRLRRHRRDLRIAEAAFGDQPPRRAQDALAVAGKALFHQAGAAVGHRHSGIRFGGILRERDFAPRSVARKNELRFISLGGAGQAAPVHTSGRPGGRGEDSDVAHRIRL